MSHPSHTTHAHSTTMEEHPGHAHGSSSTHATHMAGNKGAKTDKTPPPAHKPSPKKGK